jgi:uncharacterized protein (DUF433 family)
MSTTRPLAFSKTYTVAQAARLAGTSPQNVRRWLLGYEAPGHRMAPVFGPREPGEAALALSFLELAELIVVARFRRGSGKQIPLARLRAAHDFARKKLGIEYPFVSGKLKVEGGHIMHEFEQENPGPGKLALDRNGHYALPIDFHDAMEMFEFDTESGLASRWYPLGREVPVVVDPDHGAGWPTIKGRNVRLEVLHARWKAGWDIEEIAEDFDLDPGDVQAALRAA